MSVETQINRIKANIASAYAKAAEKGAALPVSQNSENLPDAIETIPAGGLPSGTYTISVTASDNERGTVTGSGIVSDGMSVTINAFALSGFHFVEWQMNGQKVTNQKKYSFTADKDVSFVAVFAPGDSDRLPSGYKELEYIQSSEYVTCYISFGESIPYESLKIEIYAEILSKTPSNGFTSYRILFGQNDMIVRIMNSGISLGWDGTYINNVVYSFPDKPVKIAIDKTQFSVDDAEFTISINSSGSKTTNALWIPAYTNSSSLDCAGKFYNIKVYNGLMLFMDLIPCISSDNISQFYDLISNRFFPSTSTKTFIPGPAV